MADSLSPGVKLCHLLKLFLYPDGVAGVQLEYYQTLKLWAQQCDGLCDRFVCFTEHPQIDIPMYIKYVYIYIQYIYIYTVYIYIYTYTVCVYIYMCLNMAGRAKENLPGGSPKQLFVYLKVRIFRYVYIYIWIWWSSNMFSHFAAKHTLNSSPDE